MAAGAASTGEESGATPTTRMPNWIPLRWQQLSRLSRSYEQQDSADHGTQCRPHRNVYPLLLMHGQMHVPNVGSVGLVRIAEPAVGEGDSPTDDQ